MTDPASTAPPPYGPADRQPPIDAAMLRRALDHADLRALLMAVFHLSGDERWLEPPFQPRRDTRLIAAEDAGLAGAAQAEIRAAALALLTGPAIAAPAVTDPGDSLMLRMMRVCVAEAIAPDYAPMMREELGFTPRDVGWSAAPTPARGRAPRILVVGAGASGIILAARLRRLGLDFTVVERGDQVGGTWRDNAYPGCGVDTPNHAYSFSLGNRYRWTHFFSRRDEVHDYLRRAAEEFGLHDAIRFRTEVLDASWDEAASHWLVTLRTPDGIERVETDVLVSAIGQFGLPHVPDLPGLDRFVGRKFHTTEWPRDLPLAGRRVAIIGTGASAMQIVPSIAAEVAALDIYQRTPQWARPIARYHDALTPEAQWLLQVVPFYAAWFRFSMLWRYGDGLLPHLRRDPKWPHPDRSINAMNDRHRQEMADHILAELGDRTDLIARCIPDYPPFGKRILLDNGWYRALLRPNVSLVTDAVGRIVEDGIVTADGAFRPADILVLSTGFRMTQMATRLNIRGRRGLDLREAWGDDNATAHLGITVPGFPNLFLMQGPSTGLGHGGSAICQSESQARYITGMLRHIAEQGIAAAEVRREAHDAFVARVDALHSQLIWTHPGTSTYYRNSHGRVVSVTPFSLVEYWRMTHDPDLSDFHLSMRQSE